jgi:serine/threonine protein phosphatase PrpC
MQRFENQDRYGIFAEIGLAVVADGMGGQAAGDVAAEMAVTHVCEAIVDADVTWHTDGAPLQGSGLPLLVAAIERANHCIYRAGEQSPAWRGMGTTIACLLAHGDRAVVAHVGDSRVHRLRGRCLTTLTDDHNYFRELVRHGVADPDRPEEYEACRHMLTRALGTKASVEVESRLVDVLPGDTFVVTTDGLHGVVSERALTEILLAHVSLDDAVEHMIATANHLGGPDNITAVAMRIG